ncbi:hypothetical protein Tco_0227121 [Tanacetum coccineum]
MNQEEIQQAARDEAWVPKADRVKICTINMRIDPTMTQKEETYQQFWHTVTKIKESTFFEFKLENKKCQFDVEVFSKALEICPRVHGKEFIEPPSKEELLTFLIGLGYKGELTHLPKMLIDHMHQPWRTLASIINKCLSGKTTRNDRLRQSRVAMIWGMFYRNNVDYAELIWEDFSYQIDNRQLKKGRRENIPYPIFTKVVINHFLSLHKTIPKGLLSGLNTIKDDEAYKAFIEYSTGLVPPKKTIGKSISKIDAKIADETRHVYDTHVRLVIEKAASGEESDGELAHKPQKLKGIQLMTAKEQFAADTKKAINESQKASQ